MSRRLLVLCGAILLPAALHAQGKERLTLSATTVSFTAPTVTDFDNGFLAANTVITYTVAGTGNGAALGVSHTSTVSIRSTSANLGGTKVIGDLQWRRADLGSWNAMTTTNVTVEQRTIVRGGSNDPWTNQVYFRMLLAYANDAPGAHSATLNFTLTITTP